MSSNSAPDCGFPFSAIVGQDELRLALILTAIAPRIGGVVARGEKGTAKTTTVRAFAALLGNAPLVNLPLAATEDRVLGSIDLEAVLSAGKTNYHPGLLAEADGGVLYIDEVNLLADHLSDAILDAAATGQVVIERDGISFSSPSRFVLVGTMNPEEGDLRPQLLDRFGFAVDVCASADIEDRSEIIRRRLSFDADPRSFQKLWEASEQELSSRIRSAQQRLGFVTISDHILHRIAELCASLGVEGMRPDLVIAQAAQAHAAWCDRNVVEDEDIEAVARLALRHRKFSAPGSDSEENDAEYDDTEQQDQDNLDAEIDEALEQSRHEDLTESSECETPDCEESESVLSPPPPPPNPTKGGKTEQAAQGNPFTARLLKLTKVGSESSTPGRRSMAYSQHGANIRALKNGHGFNLIGTIQAAVDRRAQIVNSMIDFRGEDLRGSQRRGKESNLIVIVMDTSGSMAAAKRVESVTGAISAMLTDAYQRRDKVAVIAAGGSQSHIVLPPTRSIELAHRRMQDVIVGGRTPLADALVSAYHLIEREHRREPGRRPMLLVITDGQDTSTAGIAGVDQAAQRLALQGLAGSVVIDCEKHNRIRLGMARRLAEHLGAPCLELSEMNADNLVGAIAI